MSPPLHLPDWAPRGTLRVGVFLPTSGAAGLWGPSCRACAELAAEEINGRGGIQGRHVELSFHDAGAAGDVVAERANRLVASHQIDAVVGMHTSDVRDALSSVLAGRLPYIYTPLYEGGRRNDAALCIGETPALQLLPGVNWLSARYRLKRWFLVGNDYIWPHTTHRLLREHWRGSSREICGEAYFPFGATDFSQLLEAIQNSRADAVVMSLVGEDSVHFNRQFARAGLADRVLRFSCAVEENMLLALGASATAGLFAASGYFASLPTAANGAFRERYYSRFDTRAPQLNTIGQSVYEGVRCLEGAVSAEGSAGFGFAGIRTGQVVFGQPSAQPIYLAEAHGLDFNIVTNLHA